jgi:hypothetical protein
VNEGALEPKTYTVSLPFLEFRKLILGEFRDSFIFKIERDTPTLLAIRGIRRYPTVLVASTDRSDESRTNLCLIPCELSTYEVSSKSPEAQNLANDIIYNLKGRLAGKAQIDDKDDIDPVIITTAHAVAIQPTLTKFTLTKNLWEKIPTSFKRAFYATVFLWGLVTALFHWQTDLKVSIEFSVYLEISVLIVLAMVAEVGIPLAQEMKEEAKVRETRPLTSP